MRGHDISGRKLMTMQELRDYRIKLHALQTDQEKPRLRARRGLPASPSPGPVDLKKRGPAISDRSLAIAGGADETRTRDLRRDRPAF